jgi:hypothetical protein
MMNSFLILRMTHFILINAQPNAPDNRCWVTDPMSLRPTRYPLPANVPAGIWLWSTSPTHIYRRAPISPTPNPPERRTQKQNGTEPTYTARACVATLPRAGSGTRLITSKCEALIIPAPQSRSLSSSPFGAAPSQRGWHLCNFAASSPPRGWEEEAGVGMGNASGREEDVAAAYGDGADVEDGGGNSSVRSSERGFPPYGSGGANHVHSACSVGGGGGAGSPPGSPGRSLLPRMFVPQVRSWDPASV